MKNKIAAAKKSLHDNKDDLIALSTATAVLAASYFVIVKLEKIPNPTLDQFIAE